VEGVEDKGGDVAGYMPLQRQVGFIYDSPNLFIIAHELGHGAFNLRHTFSPENFIAAERTTQNLMDYNGGTELWKHQWEFIRDPQNIWFAWAQEEGEGEATVSNIECYFSINSESLKISNQILNVTESNRNFNIKFLCKNDSINLDSIYLLVNTDTIKNTNVTKKFLNNMYIIAKKTGSSDTLSFLDIRVDKDSLYAKFTTKSSYKGEYGFDDGMDFSSISVPKVNMVYDTIHNSDGDVLYSPFITMDPNTTITIEASIINKMPEYNYFAESSNPAIICSYDTTTSDLKITNSNYTNTFNSPDHIFIYRKAKNNSEPKQMIGKCEVFSMNKDSVNVYILYYKHDTVPFTNTVVPSDLDDKLNKYSLNQSFKGFNVDYNIYSIIDSTVIDSIHLSTKRNAYNRILRAFMIDKVSNPGKYKSNSFYVIMSDLVFPDTGTPGAYSGGGVLSNSAYAIMWKVPFLTPADYPELIAHEGGHTFQLYDTFNDPILGNPPQKFSRHNYMDYFITRYMFFKTQIITMYNLKSTKE